MVQCHGVLLNTFKPLRSVDQAFVENLPRMHATAHAAHQKAPETLLFRIGGAYVYTLLIGMLTQSDMLKAMFTRHSGGDVKDSQHTTSSAPTPARPYTPHLNYVAHIPGGPCIAAIGRLSTVCGVPKPLKRPMQAVCCACHNRHKLLNSSLK